jgi:hypothetical protein
VRRRQAPRRCGRRHVAGFVAALAVLGLAMVLPPPAGATPTTATLTVEVTQAWSRMPIDGTSVWLFSATSNAVVAAAVTDAFGNATVQAPAGSYRLLVWSAARPHPPTWVGGATPGVEPPIVLGTGSNLVRVGVRGGGTVYGSVTGFGGPMPGARVRLLPTDGNLPVREVTVGDDGAWMATVAAGSYRLEAADADGNFPAVWFGGTLTRAAATVFTVSEGQVVEASVELSQRSLALVMGTVTADGAPAPMAVVTVHDLSGAVPDTRVLTDGRGVFFAEVPAGQVVVRAKVIGMTGEWWNDAPDEDSAVVLPVAVGSVRTVAIGIASPAQQTVPSLTGTAGGPVTVAVGDSILQFTTTRLTNRLAPTQRVSVRGYEGATVADARPVADRLAAFDPGRVVVVLGTNDLVRTTAPVTAIGADLDALLAEFPDASCIVLTTVGLTSPTGLPIPRVVELNDHLRARVGVDPRVRVADWDMVVRMAALGSGPALLDVDGIHPTDLGEARLVDLWAGALAGCP